MLFIVYFGKRKVLGNSLRKEYSMFEFIEGWTWEHWFLVVVIFITAVWCGVWFGLWIVKPEVSDGSERLAR